MGNEPTSGSLFFRAGRCWLLAEQRSFEAESVTNLCTMSGTYSGPGDTGSNWLGKLPGPYAWKRTSQQGNLPLPTRAMQGHARQRSFYNEPASANM